MFSHTSNDILIASINTTFEWEGNWKMHNAILYTVESTEMPSDREGTGEGTDNSSSGIMSKVIYIII